MIDSEVKKAIRDEIKQQLNIILNAESGQNDQQSETINHLFPGMAGITGRPVMHPAGFVSRAVQGTISVVARVGAEIHNRMTIGHRDKNRPTDLDEGEAMVYSVGGYRLKVKNNRLFLGKGGVYEEMVMGETLRQFLIAFIEEVLDRETHLGNLGFQTSNPLNADAYLELEESFLDNKKILAQDGGRF